MENPNAQYQSVILYFTGSQLKLLKVQTETLWWNSSYIGQIWMQHAYINSYNNSLVFELSDLSSIGDNSHWQVETQEQDLLTGHLCQKQNEQNNTQLLQITRVHKYIYLYMSICLITWYSVVIIIALRQNKVYPQCRYQLYLHNLTGRRETSEASPGN